MNLLNKIKEIFSRSKMPKLDSGNEPITKIKEEVAKKRIEDEEKIDGIRRQRLENPYLKEIQKQNINGKVYRNYNGIDMKSGDILRVRQLDEVGKDQDGVYLYTAYVKKTMHEHDIEMVKVDGTSEGQPICFTSDKIVEDSLNEKNRNELKGLLKLLSVPDESSKEEGFKEGELFYSGNLKKGKIDFGANNSLDIQKTIIRLQSEFRNRKDARNR